MAEWMQHTVESTLGPARAQVMARSEQRTPTGGRTFSYSPGAISYCNIAPVSAEEVEVAERLGYQAQVTCRVSLDLDADPEQRILISDSGVDELDGMWEITHVSIGFPAVDRLLYLVRLTDEA